MITGIIMPSAPGNLELIPAPLPAADSDPVRRLVAAWLAGS